MAKANDNPNCPVCGDTAQREVNTDTNEMTIGCDSCGFCADTAIEFDTTGRYFWWETRRYPMREGKVHRARNEDITPKERRCDCAVRNEECGKRERVCKQNTVPAVAVTTLPITKSRVINNMAKIFPKRDPEYLRGNTCASKESFSNPSPLCGKPATAGIPVRRDGTPCPDAEAAGDLFLCADHESANLDNEGWSVEVSKPYAQPALAAGPEGVPPLGFNLSGPSSIPGLSSQEIIELLDTNPTQEQFLEFIQSRMKQA